MLRMAPLPQCLPLRLLVNGTEEIDPRYAINFYSDTVKVENFVVTLDDGKLLVYEPLDLQLDVSGKPWEKTAGALMAKYEMNNTKMHNNDIAPFTMPMSS